MSQSNKTIFKVSSLVIRYIACWNSWGKEVKFVIISRQHRLSSQRSFMLVFYYGVIWYEATFALEPYYMYKIYSTYLEILPFLLRLRTSTTTTYVYYGQLARKEVNHSSSVWEIPKCIFVENSSECLRRKSLSSACYPLYDSIRIRNAMLHYRSYK